MTTTTTWGPVAVLQAMRAGTIGGLGHVDRLVLLVVADFAGETGAAWPSVDAVARAAGLDVKAARRAIHRLLELGVLVRDGEVMFRGGRIPRYRLGTLSLTGSDSLSGRDSLSAPNPLPESPQPTPSQGADPLRETPSDPPTTSRAPQREVSAPKRERPSRNAEKPEPHPRHREVMDAYYLAHERHRGAKPCDGGRIAKNVSVLLGKLDADEALRRIGNLFADPFSSSRTIHDLARDPDKWAAARPAIARSSAVPSLQRDPPGTPPPRANEL